MTGWLLLYALRVSLWLAAVAMAWHVLRPVAARWRRRLLLVGLAAVPLWAWLPETGDLGWRWLPVKIEAMSVPSGMATEAVPGSREEFAAAVVAAGWVGDNSAGQHETRAAWLSAGRVLSGWLVGLWLLGSVLAAGLTLVRWRRWRRLEAQAIPVATELLGSISLPLPPLPTAVLPGLPSPCVSGLIRPRLLVPPEALQWGADEWRAMVRHESQHVRQGDLWWGWWMRCLHIVLWWHPLLHGLVNRWREESELCCDQAAVADGGRRGRRVYAELLLRLVEGGGENDRADAITHGALATPEPDLMGLGSFQLRGERCLRRRLEQVLQGSSPQPAGWRQGGRLFLVALVLTAGGCGAASRPGVDPESESQTTAAAATGLEVAADAAGDGEGLADSKAMIDLNNESRHRWAAEAFPAGPGGQCP